MALTHTVEAPAFKVPAPPSVTMPMQVGAVGVHQGYPPHTPKAEKVPPSGMSFALAMENVEWGHAVRHPDMPPGAHIFDIQGPSFPYYQRASSWRFDSVPATDVAASVVQLTMPDRLRVIRHGGVCTPYVPTNEDMQRRDWEEVRPCGH
jgi:hypothetical protein